MISAAEVDRSALDHVRVEATPLPEVNDGKALIRIDEFALTANNITYAAFGDAMRYWDFFPAPAPWGRIPVWGFGSVVATGSPDLIVGERLYGYFPMASHLLITPGRADEAAVSDTAAHRAPMARAYSRYERCAANPRYQAERERLHMLLYPLFFTSFVVDDFLADQHDFGAEQILISSASSKTAIGIAFQARRRGVRVIGLTSPANAAFVEELGVFDEVRSYAAAAEIDAAPSVYVDVAGNLDIRHDVHARLGDLLAHSMAIGATHWDHAPGDPQRPLPGPLPTFFFAPTQIAKRSSDWGPAGLDDRLGAAWGRFAGWADGWLGLRLAAGPDGVVDAYRQQLAGSVDPRSGQICSLGGGNG